MSRYRTHAGPTPSVRASATRPVYIYGLADETGLRYIGQSLDPVSRENQHRRGSSGCAAADWASGVQERGGTLRFIVIDVIHPDTRQDFAEAEWIAHARTRCDLLNVSPGRAIAWEGEEAREVDPIRVIPSVADAFRAFCRSNGLSLRLSASDALVAFMAARVESGVERRMAVDTAGHSATL